MKKKHILSILCLFVLHASLYGQETIIVSSGGIQRHERAFRMGESLMVELGKKMGIPLELKVLPSIRSTNMLKKGTIHAELNRVFEYKNKVKGVLRIEEPVISLPYYVFTYHDTIKVNGWESVKPCQIVTVRGYVYVEVHLKDHNTYATGTLISAFRFLKAKRADLLITDSISPSAILDTPEFKNGSIKRLEPPIDFLHFYTYFSSRYPKYAKMYHDALVQIKKEGIYQNVVLKTP